MAAPFYACQMSNRQNFCKFSPFYKKIFIQNNLLYKNHLKVIK
jgi:hypothetical protein